jgi:cytochrome c biogenesis protein CcdA
VGRGASATQGVGVSVHDVPAVAARLLPPEPIEWLLGSVSFETSIAPALAFVAGLVLTLSPVSWPSIPAVMTVLTPAARAGTADGLTPEWGEDRQPLSRLRGALVVLGFVIGMDGVIATVGALAVSVTYLLVRGAVALSLLASVLLAVAGLRLVTRRASLCSRTLALPPNPLRAVSAGALFAVVGCPGCAPIAIGVGGAAAASGSVLISVLAIGGFVLGRWLALYAFAAAGGRLLGPLGGAHWRRLDLVVGTLFLIGALYYVLRVLLGAVETVVPGTGGVLAG